MKVNAFGELALDTEDLIELYNVNYYKQNQSLSNCNYCDA